MTKEQRVSLFHICSDIMARYDIDTKQVFGHCELNTTGKTCPDFNSDATYKSMDAFRGELELYLANPVKEIL